MLECSYDLSVQRTLVLRIRGRGRRCEVYEVLRQTSEEETHERLRDNKMSGNLCGFVLIYLSGTRACCSEQADEIE